MPLVIQLPSVDHRGLASSTRVLFIHASIDHLSSEYKVHKMLAESGTAHGVESYFLWQRGANATGDNTMTFPWPERVRYIDFGRDLSITPRPSRSQRALMMLRTLPGALRTVFSQVRAIRPDLLYTSQQKYDVRLARVLSRLFQIPHVIHIHYIFGSWLGADVLHTIQRSQNLIAVSEFIRQNALLQGIQPSAVSTVPNLISPDAFLPCGNRAAMRAEFGWGPDTPVIIAAGRLDPRKGHLPLIEAFATVLTRIPQARLLICGRTLNRSNYPEILRQRVADLGIQHAVVFAGHRYDLPALMQGADVFSLPAEMEPFGLVFLEAMAVGLPVVAYYSGAVPEIVVNGVTGFLSYPDQPTDLVDNLSRLLLDSPLASHMGAVGRQRASDAFSASVVTPRWADILHRFAVRTSAPVAAR
jgi:glycosyltransferase involved in cell wall biosynthesis